MPFIHSHNQARTSLKTFAGLGLVATVSLGWGVEGAIAQSSNPVVSTSTSSHLAQASTPITGYFLFVNPTVGNDAGEGTQRSPLRTISRALQVAQLNSVIVLSAGTYSAETGETFPLALKPGVTLQGDFANRGQGIIIRGGGEFISPTFARQNVTLLGANQAIVSGVTLTNPNPRGYGLWIESSSPTIVGNTFSGSSHDGISVTGQGAPLIQGNAFVQNGANGITVYGTSQPQIRENVFERTGFGINVAQRATPVIANNRLTHNVDGIVVQGDARPVLRGNTIEGNERDGLVAIARSLPDLGTANESGQNTFRNNGRYDLNTSAATQAIAAWGNELTGDRIHGSLNLAGRQLTGSSVATRSSPTSPTVAPPTVAPATVRSTPPATRPTMAIRPTAPASTQGFAALPQLQPTGLQPTVTPPSQVAPSQATLSPVAQPAAQGTSPGTTQGTTRPTRPERLPLLTQRLAPGRSPHSTEGVTGSTFPTPNTTNSAANPSNTTSNNTSGAIEIPVLPPGSSRSSLTAERSVRTPSTGVNSGATEVNSAANSGISSSTPVREVAVQRSSQPAPLASIPSSQSPQSPQSTRSPQPTAAIEIPVLPPQSSRDGRNNRPAQSPPLQTAPRALQPTRPAAASLAANPAPASAPSSNVLRVPNGNVPLGNIGDMPTVVVSSNPLQRRRAGAPPPVPNRAEVLGLRYRVVVEAEDETTQAIVRSLIPGAFRTQANGRIMMQAGAYSDRVNADEAVEWLTSNGLRAIVQPLN